MSIHPSARSDGGKCSMITSSIVGNNRLQKLAQNPRYISGIYNYCDRWCERCPFTSRCLDCTLAEEKFGDLGDHGLESEAFWERYAGMMREAADMIRELAEELGVDLETAVEEATESEAASRPASADLLGHVSEKYAEEVSTWFKDHPDLFTDKEIEFSQIRLLAEGDDPGKQLADLRDACEVIRWYQYFIHIKLRRALTSAEDERKEEEGDAYPKDSDGSAKVALVAIERSMAAWETLRKIFDNQAVGIDRMLLNLQSIKNLAKRQFPEAQTFKRPGVGKGQ